MKGLELCAECLFDIKEPRKQTCAGFSRAWFASAKGPFAAPESAVRSIMTNSVNLTAAKRTPSETGSATS